MSDGLALISTKLGKAPAVRDERLISEPSARVGELGGGRVVLALLPLSVELRTTKWTWRNVVVLSIVFASQRFTVQDESGRRACRQEKGFAYFFSRALRR